MKQRQWTAGLIALVLMAVAGSTALAAAGATPAKPAHEELFLPDLWATFHNPAPWLSMGLDLRFRAVSGENIYSLNDAERNHEIEYERYRFRWWTKTILSDDISFNTRLTWEFRTWDEPEYKAANTLKPFGEGNNLREFNPDEALFDWFNLSMRNIAGLPLTATIGRQDIIFGVGWLVLDATPLDGSRTLYFDAARFTYDWADAKTKIDLIYIDQSAKSDRFLKPINDQDRAVTEQEERGAILYVTNKSLEKTQLEGFFIYKNDNPIDGPVTNVPPSVMPPSSEIWSKRASIYTFGGAISGTPAENWRYRAEGALQTGRKDNAAGVSQDIHAYGALTNLEYLFKDEHNCSAHIGYEYASGDDPGSEGSNQEFDLLWGEWPRYSELLIYTATYETQPAALTNLHRANVGLKFDLNKQWTFTADYHALWAADNTGAAIPPGIALSDDHKFRGSLYTAWARYKFSDQLYGHIMGEIFAPDNYYVAPSDDSAYFLRFNLEYVF
jgi:hypothetical protein